MISRRAARQLIVLRPEQNLERVTEMANLLYFAAHQNADRQLKGSLIYLTAIIIAKTISVCITSININYCNDL